MTYEAAEFTRQAVELVAQGDRVPTQRVGSPSDVSPGAAWDEAVQALAWALDQPRATPVNALDYVRHHNPYRTADGRMRA